MNPLIVDSHLVVVLLKESPSLEPIRIRLVYEQIFVAVVVFPMRHCVGD